MPTATDRAAATRAAAAWEILRGVMDPEVPVLSIVELGIVREVAVEGDAATVTITPTYSGCPAMRVIEADIVAALAAAGFPAATVRTVYHPAWTSDWIGEEGRRKLREYGIAPPPARAGAADEPLVPIVRRAATVACPYCGSTRTTLRSEFGSTACKSTLFCDACRQPFEQFKAI
jgi:ring-1,2-phenylacetyl-CoA epoxidase subunit PaaD